ncbi:LysR family transcriptional regulator, partial [Streptomyces rochei]
VWGAGTLRASAGGHGPGVVVEVAAARGRARPPGPVADQLWDFLARHAPLLRPALGRVPEADGAPERHR